MEQLKWCTSCKMRHDVSAFGGDRSRSDGLSACCLDSRRVDHPPGWKPKPPINPLTGRPGPAAKPGRDGDKLQARARINVEVKRGRRPHPNKLPCTDCGHVWLRGERRHEYDHHLGYNAAHHLDVEPVCTTCHAIRDSAKKKQTHCKRGHEFTPPNVITGRNGTRKCRECRREYERRRTPRGSEFWKRISAKRRAA